MYSVFIAEIYPYTINYTQLYISSNLICECWLVEHPLDCSKLLYSEGVHSVYNPHTANYMYTIAYTFMSGIRVLVGIAFTGV